MLLASVIIFGLLACTSVTEKLPVDDKIIAASLIGTWVAEASDKNALPGISNYRGNGRLEYVGFQTSKCVTPNVLVKARWRVQNRFLIIVVQDSTNHDWYPPGLIVEDQIIEISNDRMVLENSLGDLEYRLRNLRCSVKGTH
ncbi:MAG: hypothetical protein GXP08_13765 [Gammaproteobacteria bacterium]|nr:hypothetical protein [Gammaproteobacteria bacterium]